MKLRINGNSIRLRLTPAEVERISQLREVHCSCVLPQGELNYSLNASEDWSVNMKENELIIEVPSSLCLAWCESERVGFEKQFDSGLFLLIEKDFQCLKPRAYENEDHLYPNPEKID